MVSTGPCRAQPWPRSRHVARYARARRCPWDARHRGCQAAGSALFTSSRSQLCAADANNGRAMLAAPSRGGGARAPGGRTVRTICASRSMRRLVASRQMPIAEPSAPSRTRSVPAAPAPAAAPAAGTAACARADAALVERRRGAGLQRASGPLGGGRAPNAVRFCASLQRAGLPWPCACYEAGAPVGHGKTWMKRRPALHRAGACCSQSPPEPMTKLG